MKVSVEEETAWLLVQWSSCLCSNPEDTQDGRMVTCEIPLRQFCLSSLEGALVEPRQLQCGFTIITVFNSSRASGYEAQAYKQKQCLIQSTRACMVENCIHLAKR